MSVPVITSNLDKFLSFPLKLNSSPNDWLKDSFVFRSPDYVDFTKSNMAYTSLSAGAFTLNGLKDGGTYTLAVQGGTSGICSFTGNNPAGTAFVFKSTNNGNTVATKQALYTFLVMGTTIYFYMVAGF